jgi:predicted  nucleic acid-binding Zn-ribbon protein
MDKPGLDMYETMRRSKGDEPIARVEQGMCKGCRINLPTNTLQKARTGQELVYCIAPIAAGFYI